MTKYRVYWVSKITGKSGMDEPLEKPVAEEWAEHGNKDYPDVLHWIVEDRGVGP